MTIYLGQAVYSGDIAAKGLLQEGGTKRKEAAITMFESLGAQLLSPIYYGFGKRVDLFCILEVPDQATMATIVMLGATAGLDVTLTELMEVDVIDAASQKSPTYRPPGQ